LGGDAKAIQTLSVLKPLFSPSRRWWRFLR
jgi:hypothetical protein